MPSPLELVRLKSDSLTSGAASGPSRLLETGSPDQLQPSVEQPALRPLPRGRPPALRAGFVSRIQFSMARWVPGGSGQARAAAAGGAGGRGGPGAPGTSPSPSCCLPTSLPGAPAPRKTENGLCGPTSPPGCSPSPEAIRPGGTPVPFSPKKGRGPWVKEPGVPRPAPAARTPLHMPGPGVLPSPQRRSPGVGRRRSLPGGTGGWSVGGGGLCIWRSGGGSASGGLRPGVGPGSGAQRRRFGEPGLSSAASNSMGRFNVAPHAMPPPTGRGRRADAAVTAAQPSACSAELPPEPSRLQWRLQHPAAPPAPPPVTSRARPPPVRGVGSRKRAVLGGSAGHRPPPAPPPERMERPGRRTRSPSNRGKAPASAPPRVPAPAPSLAAAPRQSFRVSHLRGAGLGEGRARIGKLRGVRGGASGSGSRSPVTSHLVLAPG